MTLECSPQHFFIGDNAESDETNVENSTGAASWEAEQWEIVDDLASAKAPADCEYWEVVDDSDPASAEANPRPSSRQSPAGPPRLGDRRRSTELLRSDGDDEERDEHRATEPLPWLPPFCVSAGAVNEGQATGAATVRTLAERAADHARSTSEGMAASSTARPPGEADDEQHKEGETTEAPVQATRVWDVAARGACSAKRGPASPREEPGTQASRVWDDAARGACSAAGVPARPGDALRWFVLQCHEDLDDDTRALAILWMKQDLRLKPQAFAAWRSARAAPAVAGGAQRKLARAGAA